MLSQIIKIKIQQVIDSHHTARQMPDMVQSNAFQCKHRYRARQSLSSENQLRQMLVLSKRVICFNVYSYVIKQLRPIIVLPIRWRNYTHSSPQIVWGTTKVHSCCNPLTFQYLRSRYQCSWEPSPLIIRYLLGASIGKLRVYSKLV